MIIILASAIGDMNAAAWGTVVAFIIVILLFATSKSKK